MAPAASIDVVIPVRNGSATIRAAVVSVLAQTFAAFRLIVVDDGSDDDLSGALAGIADERLVLVSQAQRGVSAARNRGVAEGSAEWITFLDCDDTARSTWLEELLRVGGDAEVVGGGGSIHREGLADWERLPRQQNGQRPEVLYLAGFYAVRRAVFEAIGGFCEELRFSENTDLGLRIDAFLDSGGRMAITPTVLVEIYQPASRRRRAASPSVLAESALLMLERHEAYFAAHRRHRASYLAVAGLNLVQLGDRRRGRRCLGLAVRCAPLSLRYWRRFIESWIRRSSPGTLG